MHLSQGRPQIELQVVSYEGGRAKVVFILAEREESQGNEVTMHHGTYGSQGHPHSMHAAGIPHTVPHVPVINEPAKNSGMQLLKVGQIHWVGGHAPNDQPWGDPGTWVLLLLFLQAAVVFLHSIFRPCRAMNAYPFTLS